MEDGAARWGATGFRTWASLFAAERAICLIRAGEREGAETAIAEAQAALEATGERQAEAPLGLARALAHADRGDVGAALAAASAARAVAQRQGAALWRDRIDAVTDALRGGTRVT
jgi:hypothetical protein